MINEFKLAIPVIIATLGWFVVNWLASNRETKKKKLELRSNYLIGAYQALNELRTRQNSLEQQEAISLITRILADTQLFGSTYQIELAQKLAKEVVQNNGKVTCVHDLANDLRDSLRDYLGLSKVTEPSGFLELHVPDKIQEQGVRNQKHPRT